MPRKSEEQLVRVHLHMPIRDLERIEALFGSEIKRSEAIRMLISRILTQIEEKAEAQSNSLPIPRLTRAGLDYEPQ